MRFNLKSSYLAAALVTMAPMAAQSASVNVNNACLAGSCGSTDAVSYGANTSSPFDFNYAVGADTYRISGDYSASYDANGTAFSVTMDVTYTGSAPSTTADTLKIDVLQSFYDNSPGTWDGTYTANIPLSMDGNVGPGSTVSAQVLYDGQSLGQAGPFGPGSHSTSESANLTGLTGDYLNADFQYIYTFEPGTDPGAGAGTGTVTPEPRWTMAAGMGLLSLALVPGIRRRRNGLGRSV